MIVQDIHMKEFLLFLAPLSFSGLHTTFFCSATTVGCLGFHDPGTCEGGLPLNLLLLGPIGVASIGASLDCGNGEDTLEVRHTLCGSQTNDWRPMTRSVLISLAEDFWTGVDMPELDSGRKVAIEALLLGWKTWPVVVAGDGLTAMEPRLACRTCFRLFSLETLLFSFSSLTTGRYDMMLFLFAGAGDGAGMKLVIRLSGSRSFDGAIGGFLLSVELFCAWFDVKVGWVWVASEAKVLFSCFSLVFLSSANWVSRSRTCKRMQYMFFSRYLSDWLKKIKLSTDICTFSWRFLQICSLAASLNWKVCTLSCNFLVSFSSCFAFSACSCITKHKKAED